MLSQNAGNKKQKIDKEQKPNLNTLSTSLKRLVMSFLQINDFGNLASTNKSINYAAKQFIRGIDWLAVIKKGIAINNELGLDHHSARKKREEKEYAMPLAELKSEITEFLKFTSLLSKRLISHHNSLRPFVMNQRFLSKDGSSKEVVAVLDDASLSEDDRRERLKKLKINDQIPVFHRTASILQEAEAVKKTLKKARKALEDFKQELEKSKESPKLNLHKKTASEHKREKALIAAQEKKQNLEAALVEAQEKYDSQNELLFFLFQLNTSRISILLEDFLKVKSLLDREVKESTLVCIKRLAPAWNNYHARFYRIKKEVFELYMHLRKGNINQEVTSQRLQTIRAKLDEPILLADEKSTSCLMTMTQFLKLEDIFKQKDKNKIVEDLCNELDKMKKAPVFFQANIKKEDMWSTREALMLWGFTEPQLASVIGWQMGTRQQHCYLTSDLIKARLELPWIAKMKTNSCAYLKSSTEVAHAEHLPEIVRMMLKIQQDPNGYAVTYDKTAICKSTMDKRINKNHNSRFAMLCRYSSPEGQFLKDKFMKEQSGCPLPVAYSSAAAKQHSDQPSDDSKRIDDVLKGAGKLYQASLLHASAASANGSGSGSGSASVADSSHSHAVDMQLDSDDKPFRFSFGPG